MLCHWIAARSERYATFSGLLGAQELHQDSCEEQLLPNAHSESRLGSAKEADLCCQKGTQSEEEWHTFQWNGPNFGVEADFVTAGVGTREPGVRSDLRDVVDMIHTGASLRQLASNFPEQFILQHRGMERYTRGLLRS